MYRVQAKSINKQAILQELQDKIIIKRNWEESSKSYSCKTC